MRVFLVGAVTLFLLAGVLAVGSYIGARIMLPGMGLSVPDFAAFYWSSVFGLVFAGLIGGFTSFVKELI